MNWVFVGILMGTVVTSTHDSREACEGRRVVLAEKGVNGKCVELSATRSYTGTTIAPLTICGTITCNN